MIGFMSLGPVPRLLMVALITLFCIAFCTALQANDFDVSAVSWPDGGGTTCGCDPITGPGNCKCGPDYTHPDFPGATLTRCYCGSDSVGRIAQDCPPRCECAACRSSLGGGLFAVFEDADLSTKEATNDVSYEGEEFFTACGLGSRAVKAPVAVGRLLAGAGRKGLTAARGAGKRVLGFRPFRGIRERGGLFRCRSCG